MPKTSVAAKSNLSRTDLSQASLPAEIVTILDGYSAPSILLNADYRILAANRAYRDRYTQDRDPRWQYCYTISHGNQVPCDQAGEQCPLQGSRLSGEARRILHVHHTPNGTEHVDVETRPIRNKSGKILYYVEILRHIGAASADSSAHGLVGNSPVFNRVLELIQRVAPSEVTVLLLGESGTGKELAAQAIHGASKRARQPFVPVECAGLTEALFESELFGHEKGAFTGAYVQKSGLVEAAHGGTMLLDEVGDIPLSLQVKLLRLLETGTYRRVGSVESKRVDFRLICATHRDLKAMVDAGAFRQDLYYRINMFPITLPALRERPEDLRLLADALARRIAGHRNLVLHPQTLDLLARYHFPGNVRELRNILERASLLVDGNTIMSHHLPEECLQSQGAACGSREKMGTEAIDGEEILPLDVVEKRYIRHVLTHYRGEKSELAKKLGVSERTLYRKIRNCTQNPSGTP
ncbi:MAG: sigma54 specific transcriptional regulator, Fis family [Candidatus Kentron sp. G]|nr:MAG: sigma54 specific transcriptional regulator, Fis family [Candidatus Kentron sp. G]VFN05159.1 MAG: sigma54 specific transcriptional regulator, Fis family [Candidatus Kentron sp. G]VFN05423.1 MAG: sigma54 specific transcriptional regulator, Fis family [Candidatus Kentron sp. G]